VGLFSKFTKGFFNRAHTVFCLKHSPLHNASAGKLYVVSPLERFYFRVVSNLSQSAVLVALIVSSHFWSTFVGFMHNNVNFGCRFIGLRGQTLRRSRIY